MAATHVLDLAPERIRLLRKDGDAAELLCELDTDAPDLSVRLKAEIGAAGTPPLAAHLVLPDSQILYTRIDLPVDGDGRPGEESDARVRAALDGLTPYALDEIAFDWEPDGDTARVAAIALETLDEARRFAEAHGFTVCGYGALPGREDFPREVVFPLGGSEDEALAEAVPMVPPHADDDERDGTLDPDADPTGDEDAAAIDGQAGKDEIAGDETADDESANDEQADDDPADDEPADAPAPAAAPAFNSRRSGVSQIRPETLTSAAFAGSAPRFQPLDPAPPTPLSIPPSPSVTADFPAGVTSPGLPEAAPRPAPDGAPDPVVTTGAGFTADGVPDHGPAAASLRPPIPPAPRAQGPGPTDPPAPPQMRAAGGAGLPFGPAGKRIAVAALVAFLLIAGAWTLVATFTPRTQVDSALNLPAPVEIPETAGSDGTATEGAPTETAAFTPTDEELAETAQEGLLMEEALAAEPTPAPEDPARGEGVADGVVALQTPPAAPDAPPTPADGQIETAAIDPRISSTDAISLPAIGRADTPPDASPPPADADLPTPADLADAAPDPSLGADAPPGGVALDLGGGATAPIEGLEAGDLAPTDLASTLPEDFRPRGRPEDLVERTERAIFGGRSLDELAELRPRERPASPQADPGIDPAPTDLAVVRSPEPRARPDDMDEVVAAARATLSAEPPAAAASASTAAVVTREEEEAEPEVATAAAAPRLPTRAEVAREATIDNAIRLGQVNLIGVYGTASNRRALIRLPSGRYVKVKVGDRIDGGQIAAIGDNDLRYVKGGRNITLTVPSG